MSLYIHIHIHTCISGRVWCKPVANNKVSEMIYMKSTPRFSAFAFGYHKLDEWQRKTSFHSKGEIYVSRMTSKTFLLTYMSNESTLYHTGAPNISCWNMAFVLWPRGPHWTLRSVHIKHIKLTAWKPSTIITKIDTWNFSHHHVHADREAVNGEVSEIALYVRNNIWSLDKSK